MRILELSYNHLPQHLKPCFLYLGVFHEDQEIPVREMMKLWIAEGFIHKKNEKNVEEVAEEYLTEIIDKSLVLVGKRRSDGGLKTCLIHDLLRDLCLKRCEEEKLLRFVNVKYYKTGEGVTKIIQNPITWFYRHQTRDKRKFPVGISDMRLQRVLYFCRSSIYLTGIEYLVSLKYLIIGDLPLSVGNFVNLEYLHVETQEKVYLSSSVLKLRDVHVASGARYGKDCNTSQKNELEVLSYVLIWKFKDIKMLKCSPNLRRLKCYCDHGSWVPDLSFLTQLESLHLQIAKSPFRGEIILHSSIKKLNLDMYGNELCWKALSVIGRLENLEALKLHMVEFEGYRWDTREGEVGFATLECWVHRAFQRLGLPSCCYLEEIPCEIVMMQMIEVYGSQRLVESAKRIQQEQIDMGSEELRVILPSSHTYLR